MTRSAHEELLDPRRLDALDETGLLDHLPLASLDRFTRIAAAALGMPVSLVSLVDNRRQFFVSQVGLPAPWSRTRETPLSHSFCQHVVTRRAPLVVEDSRKHPVVRGHQVSIGPVATPQRGTHLAHHMARSHLLFVVSPEAPQQLARGDHHVGLNVRTPLARERVWMDRRIGWS